MMHGISGVSGRFFLSVAAVLCMSATVQAAPPDPVVAGCDPLVLAAMNAKAQAQVAYDVAVIRELVSQPESVLDLTCFSRQAGISAKNGGAVFSGDFTDSLKTVVPVTPSPNDKFACTAMADMWKAVSEQGVSTQVPYASFTDLMSGTMPVGAGDGYKAGWDAATKAGVFGQDSQLSRAMTALDDQKPQPVDFSGAKSSCDVLVAAQIIPGPCGTPTGSADPTTK